MNNVKKVAKTLGAAGVAVSFATVSVTANEHTAPIFVNGAGKPISESNKGSVIQTINVGEKNFDPLKNISAYDTDEAGNELNLKDSITYDVITDSYLDRDGNFVFNKAGKLEIRYRVEDEYGNKAELRVVHNVVGPKPVINVASGKKLTFGYGSVVDEKEILTGLTADSGDGQIITDLIEVDGKIDTTKPGKQSVIVRVENDYGEKTQLELIYNIGRKPSIDVVETTNVVLGQKFNPLEAVKATGSFGEDITNRIRVKEGEVDTSKEGSYEVVFSVEDNYGYSETTVVFIVSEPKLPAPQIDFLGDGKQILVNDTSFNPLDYIVAYDDAGNDYIDDVTIQGEVDVTTPGTYTIYYSVVNAEGNRVTTHGTFVVVEKHVSPPVINAEDKEYEVKQGQNDDNYDLTYEVYATDPVDDDVEVKIKNDGGYDRSKVGEYKVTYIATNKGGLSTEKTVIVRVVDTQTPKIRFKQGVNNKVKFGSKPDYRTYFELSDNYYDEKDLKFEVVSPLDTKQEGRQDIVVRVTDPSGNYDEFTFEFVVEPRPETKPVINAKDKVIDVGSKFDPLEGVTATDEIDGKVPVKVIENNVDTSKLGTYTVVYEAGNEGGYYSTHEIKVTVADQEAPVVKLKDGVKTHFEYGEKVDLESLFVVSDNYNKPEDISLKIIKGLSTTVSGEQTVIVEVMDTSGNRKQYEFTFTVAEAPKTKPVINAKNREIYVNKKFDPMVGVTAMSEDGKDLTKYISVESSNVNTKKPGTYEVTYVVKDENGGVARKTITVKVLDGTAPVLKVRKKVHIAKGQPFDYMIGLLSAEDNVDGNLTSKVKIAGTVNVDVAGEYKLVYSVTDSSGNKASKEVIVYVHDIDVETEDGSPVLIVEDVEIIEGNDFNPLAGIVALDQKDGDITSKIKVSGKVDTNRPGQYALTYSVTNSQGLTTERQITVTVKSKDIANVDSSPDADYEQVVTFDQTPTLSLAAPSVMMSLAALVGLKKKKE